MHLKIVWGGNTLKKPDVGLAIAILIIFFAGVFLATSHISLAIENQTSLPQNKSSVTISASIVKIESLPTSDYISTTYYPRISQVGPQAGPSNFTYSTTTEPIAGNVSPNIYGSNIKVCSSQPTGTYCDDWEASCNPTSSVASGQKFYVYHRIYDAIHGTKTDITETVSATDPSNNDVFGKIPWNWKTDWGWTPAWFCVYWWFYLNGPTGTWNIKYELKDNIDNSESSFNIPVDMICNSNSNCSSSQQCINKVCVVCSARSESAWVVQDSNTCNQNLVTRHKFKNDGPSDLTYDILFNVYDPDGVLIGSSNKSGEILSKNSDATWEVIVTPPSGGWVKQGTYKVKAKFVGKCSTDVIVENEAYPKVLNAPCPSCKPVSVSAWVSQDNLCRENIITYHKFENQGEVKIPYDIKFYLYDNRGTLVDSVSSSGQLSVGYQTTWWVRWAVPSGGWRSGTYESHAEFIGKCWDGDKTVRNSANPQISTSCDSSSSPSTCVGIIYVDVKDSSNRPIPNSRVYLDGSYIGNTDSNGKRTLTTTDSSCGNSHTADVYCENGNFCDSRSTVIDWNNDDDNILFTCDVCTVKPGLDISVSSNSKLVKGDRIKLEISVKNGGSNVDGAYVRVYDPFYQNYWGGNTNAYGRIDHISSALKTGTYTYKISANKDGYNSGSRNFIVTVTDFNGKIFVTVNDLKGNAIQNAKVYLDSKLDGSTDSSGKRTLITSKGSHTIDTYCSSGNICGSKSLYVSSIESANFKCQCDSGDSDADGISDEEERLIGSDPFDKNSNLESLLTDWKLNTACFNPFSLLSAKLTEDERISLINSLNNSANISTTSVLETVAKDKQVSPLTFEEALETSDKVDVFQANGQVIFVLTDADTGVTSIFRIGAHCSGILVGMLFGAGHGVKDDISIVWSVFKGAVFYAQNSKALADIPNQIVDTFNSIPVLFANIGSIFHELSLDIFKEGASVNYVKYVPGSDKRDYAAFNVGFYEGFITGYVGEQVLLGKGVVTALKSLKSVGKVVQLVEKVSELEGKVLQAITRITERFGGEVPNILKRLIASNKGLAKFGKWSEEAQDGISKLIKITGESETGKILEGLSDDVAEQVGKNFDTLVKDVGEESATKLLKSDVGKTAIKSWSLESQKGLLKITEKYGDDIVKNIVTRYGEDILKITSKGTEAGVIDINKINPEKLSQYIRGVQKIGVSDPIGDIGKHELLKMFKSSGASTKVGTETVDGVAVLKKGDLVEGWGWEHISKTRPDGVNHAEEIRKAFNLADNDNSVKNFIGEALEKGTKDSANPYNIVYQPSYSDLRLKVVLNNEGSITTAFPFD